MIGVLGLSHKTATIEIREKFTFSPEESVALMKHMLDTTDASGVVLLSTCNRTEIYFHATTSHPSLPNQIEKEILLFKKANDAQVKKYFYHLTDEICYKHLFNLTSGLDSMVLGEYQILGQVKDAFRLSVENSCSSTIISRLFHKAFEAGKKVRNLYNISSVPLSAGSAAVDFVVPQFPNPNDIRVLIVGAGQMAENVILGLRKHNISNISICNRTIERANKLALRYKAKVLPENKVKEGIENSNLIFAATSALVPVITAQMVVSRPSDPAVFFDLAVPRNIEDAVGNFAGHNLLSIDSLKNGSPLSFTNEHNIALAEELINQSVNEFRNWILSLNLSPTIDMLQHKFDEVLDQRLDFLKHKVSEHEYKLISQTGKFLKDKYLRNIISSLKDLSENGTKQDYIEMINRMLEYQYTKKA